MALVSWIDSAELPLHIAASRVTAPGGWEMEWSGFPLDDASEIMMQFNLPSCNAGWVRPGLIVIELELVQMLLTGQRRSGACQVEGALQGPTPPKKRNNPGKQTACGGLRGIGGIMDI